MHGHVLGLGELLSFAMPNSCFYCFIAGNSSSEEAFPFSDLPLVVQHRIISAACKLFGQKYRYGIIPLVSRHFYDAAKSNWGSLALSEALLAKHGAFLYPSSFPYTQISSRVSTDHAGDQVAWWLSKNGHCLIHFSNTGSPWLSGEIRRPTTPLAPRHIAYWQRYLKAVTCVYNALGCTATSLQSLQHINCIAALELDCLEHLTSLTSLRVEATGCSKSLLGLSRLQCLELLRQSGPSSPHSRPVTGGLEPVFSHLATLTQLTKLKVSETLDDPASSLSALTKLRNLKHLDLMDLNMKSMQPRDLVYLEGVPVSSFCLKLAFDAANIAAACAWLRDSAPHLTQLRVEGAGHRQHASEVSKICCSIAEGVPQLRELTLQHLDLSDSMPQLARLTRLVNLKTNSCHHSPQLLVSSLKKAGFKHLS